MRVAQIATLAATAALALGATPAGANTLNYAGDVGPTDLPTPGFVYDLHGPTACGTPATFQFAFASAREDLYAFRNLSSSSSDCVTVSGVSDPDALRYTTQVSDGGGFGSDAPFPGPAQSYALDVGAGQIFTTFVTGFPDNVGHPVPYTLSVSGTQVANAQLLDVRGASLPGPGGNTVDVFASALRDGSAPEGTLSAHTTRVESYIGYTGPIRCLRADGLNASVVMTFDGTEQGLASKWKGAVYWFHQSPDGSAGAPPHTPPHHTHPHPPPPRPP